MSGSRDWERERQRKRAAAAKRAKEPKRKTVAVHPNSMAARKWGVKFWETDA